MYKYIYTMDSVYIYALYNSICTYLCIFRYIVQWLEVGCFLPLSMMDLVCFFKYDGLD